MTELKAVPIKADQLNEQLINMLRDPEVKVAVFYATKGDLYVDYVSNAVKDKDAFQKDLLELMNKHMRDDVKKQHNIKG